MNAKNRRWTTALAATGVLAGGVAAGVIGVVAATATSVLTATTSSASPSSTAAGDPETKDDSGLHGESTVTGAKATTLRTAASKAVPGGTGDRIETDADDAAHEVHMTEADGSKATVQFDAMLSRTGIGTGMGKGGRDAAGGDGENANS